MTPVLRRRAVGESGVAVSDLVTLVVFLGIVGGIGFGVWKVFIAAPAPTAYSGQLESTGELVEGCGRVRNFFPGNQPYAGKAPHPVGVFEISDGENLYANASSLLTADERVPGQWRPLSRQATQVQLIACADQSGKGDTIKTCHFDNPGIDVPLRKADYEVRVFEARTGREVAKVEIRDAEHTSCPFVEIYREGDDPEVFSTPTLAQYRRALAHLVDRPAA